ncbi:glycosyl hydrolase [Constantimarinum furrinae]|uniref:Glycosyl hydrolase n=1 Tax=Constantimarinum furrinae TaxID=2562285 RepID=A0A7G8PWL7_9FLAO|nr:glycosyl hydrolase [Constantimarinum furrinae]QNJ98733.1 hypothetical protein ALE3EI_2188 [Constantimarinum furrinae]
MKINIKLLVSGILFFCLFFTANAQRKTSNNQKQTTKSTDSIYNGLALRNIGPAFMSGRISDVAIHPENENIWYVAVSSGGVWKTVNSGTTWTPVFDSQPSYSMGCITLDPNNPDIVWVGTGENVGGRHMGYGDGIYRSTDGGTSWKNMGLKNSEHISKIIIHPENSKIMWVAVQGPLWNKGGDRGLYKSTDGGGSWKKTLGDDEWVGVTDIVVDSRNPDVMYAATWQRHRNVAAYMGGGPGSGIHKSIDGGDTWIELTHGLPDSWMGKIGLAISPQNPDIVYAAIELDRRTGGVYRSANRGATWEKRSDAVAGATGPHYYQELYASPHHFEKLYLVDSNLQISDDGGKTFYRMNENNKHGDNHSVSFRKDDPNYLLIGTDGGLYESFDLTKTWKYVENLPVTQFYKIAVDDAEPFYNIYGGTQDNSTQGGPSRTDNTQGIQNSNWKVVLNWDGHQPATEPGNPDIIYAERQEGNLSRIDMSTGEVTDIQPQAGANEPHERFNWDAPILVSPHSPTRIYFASYRVWKSDDRGNNWMAISGDLTRSEERITLPIMGKKQPWDAPWDMLAMSNYNTITSLAESPKQPGLIYAGTDDGLIQVTEDGGSTWRKIEVGSLPGVPSTAFVNDIKADLFDVNTVYVALDNHKYGDLNPYLYMSTDKGRTWKSIASNIPKRTLVWRLVQDHVNSNLLFTATEFGIYFSVNKGNSWNKLQGGAPTISFRDLAIQRRENDLVGASFGRGIFILDDYIPLRSINDETLKNEAVLFPLRDAWWFVPRSDLEFGNGKGSMGDSHFVAPNPDFGAVFTYYLKDGLKSSREIRKMKEKNKEAGEYQFPGWDTLDKEKIESGPQIILTIFNDEGQAIRRINGPVGPGFHRLAWDLRYPPMDGIALNVPANASDGSGPQGFLASPGNYSGQLSKVVNGVATPLSEKISFTVKPMYKSAIPGANVTEVTEFYRSYEKSVDKFSALNIDLNKAMKRLTAMETALKRTQAAPGSLDSQLYKLRQDLMAVNVELNGNQSKLEIGEKTKPTIGERMFAVYRGIERSTYGPTGTHLKSMEIINSQLNTISVKMDLTEQLMDAVYKELRDAGAPYIED